MWYNLSSELKKASQTVRIFYYHHMYGTPKDWYESKFILSHIKYKILT